MIEWQFLENFIVKGGLRKVLMLLLYLSFQRKLVWWILRTFVLST
jgi:hypothetical protein